MAPKTIPAVQARVHLGDIMNRAFKKGESFIVEKSGIPIIAIVSAAEYTQLTQEREERFRVIDQIKRGLPNAAALEIETDINQVVKATRKRRA